jgi:hypothetical protein
MMHPASGAGPVSTTVPPAAVPFNPFSAYATREPSLTARAGAEDLGAMVAVKGNVCYDKVSL